MQVISSGNLATTPFVSVVIPSYNRKEYISQCINSILSQECDFDFEIIIGDDCSTDGVRDLLVDFQQQYPEKIKLLLYDENIGLAANWATCVKQCKGKYIANCDNDDYWHEKTKLQRQIDYLEITPEVGLLTTDFQIIKKNGEIEQQVIHQISYGDELFDVLMRFDTPNFVACNAAIVYRAEVLFKYVKLDDYIKYKFTLQDWNTWLFLSRHTKFACLPLNTTTVRLNNESITRPKSYEAVISRMSKEKSLYKYMCEQMDVQYIEQKYDDYIYRILLNLAFIKNDYPKAKEFANRLSIPTKKVKYTKNRCLFLIFCFMKRMKMK